MRFAGTLTADGVAAMDSGTVYGDAFPDPALGYELVRNLDFEEPSSYESGQINADWIGGEGWQPIAYLAGSFHGNSHTISNLYIRRAWLRVGLFSPVG